MHKHLFRIKLDVPKGLTKPVGLVIHPPNPDLLVNSTFDTYQEWRAAITGPCGLTLDRAYCEQRIAALRDDEAPGTRPFLDTYGPDYRDQVIAWFEQALTEA